MTTCQVQAVAPVLPQPSSWLNRAVAAILAGLAAFFLTIAPGQSTETSPAARAGEIGSGSLLIRGDDGVETSAVRLGTDADLTVSGPTIRARITQVFRNDTAGWVEARYVYPLPDGGAVDTLKMIAGGRLIIGNVKERREAQAAFEQARRDGRKAALVEQQRPNIFSNSVANIGPGETVLVQIEYQEPVHLSGDEFSLRLPLVVGPRYNPTPLVQSVDLRAGDGGWGASTTDPVPDRDRITPPLNDPAVIAPINPTTITVRLQAGFPIREVKSHHHQVTIEEPDATTRVIRLANGPVPADRDFELTWTSAAAHAPSVGLFREHIGDADYVLAYVTPPVDETPQAPLPREVIFVIDNSGSMGGTSIAQARASLLYALGRLGSADRFNVIRFDDTMDQLFSAAVPADASHLDRARAFVAALEARGGTEMVPAMRAALTDDRADDAKGLRQVVFLTDGAIGNEQQLFDTIAQMSGRSRVFMVGIGSAPNTYLMTRASEIGRGAFTHIGSVDQVEERMRGLFAKLEKPAVTSLTASFSSARAEMTPAVLPDLYRGEPLMLAARLDKLAGSLDLGGRIGERSWHVTLPLASAAEGKGLSKLWARRKIADAEIGRTLRQISPEEADRSILKLALTHQLVSRLTSLVAVDETPSRPGNAPLRLAELPINLPAGWDYATLMGDPATRMRALPPPVDQRRADAGRVRVADANALKLPQTATDADLRMLIGLVLLAFATLAMFVNRRQLSPR